MKLRFVDDVQSLLTPIRAISIGGMAHEYLCYERLKTRASQAIDTLSHHRDGPSSWRKRYGRVIHASGLAGAVGMRGAIRPGTLCLELLVGTGRHRYTGPECLDQSQKVTYFDAFLAHPLDTGLLGLWSASNAAKHALIAGTLGAVVGHVVGVVLWPLLGRPRDVDFRPFVDKWTYRGAFSAGVFGALMGSCFIWTPYNFIVLQCLRVLTALPALLASILGYVTIALLAFASLLVYDAAVGGNRALEALWPRQNHPGPALGASLSPGLQTTTA